MPNTKYDAIINLIPSENVKAVVILFLLSSKGFKEKLFKCVAWAFKQIIKYLPKLRNKLARELAELKDAMPEEDEQSKKISAWGMMIIYVLYAAIMGTYMGAFIFKLLFTNHRELTFFKILMMIALITFFGCIAWFYRATAHKVANDNGINKYPWKQKAI
jgi:hypothetical protein